MSKAMNEVFTAYKQMLNESAGVKYYKALKSNDEIEWTDSKEDALWFSPEALEQEIDSGRLGDSGWKMHQKDSGVIISKKEESVNENEEPGQSQFDQRDVIEDLERLQGMLKKVKDTFKSEMDLSDKWADYLEADGGKNYTQDPDDVYHRARGLEEFWLDLGKMETQLNSLIRDFKKVNFDLN